MNKHPDSHHAHHPHHTRHWIEIFLIAITSLVIILAVGIGVLRFAPVQQSLELTAAIGDQLPAESVVAYFRADDASIRSQASAMSDTSLPPLPPDIFVMQELAIVRTGSGLQWIAQGTSQSTEAVIAFSRPWAESLLKADPNAVQVPFSKDLRFRSLFATSQPLSVRGISAISWGDSQANELVQALLQPYSFIAVQSQNGDREISLIKEGSGRSALSTSFAEPSAFEDPSLILYSASPALLGRLLQESLEQHAPDLWIGLYGIFQHHRNRILGKNDSGDAALSALFSSPTSIEVALHEPGDPRILVAGQTNAALALTTIMDTFAQSLPLARVRNIELLDGNTRTDVIADPTAITRTNEHAGGYEITTLSQSGSVRSLSLAMRGKNYILSNDHAAALSKATGAVRTWTDQTAAVAHGMIDASQAELLRQRYIPFLDFSAVPLFKELWPRDATSIEWSIVDEERRTVIILRAERQ